MECSAFYAFIERVSTLQKRKEKKRKVEKLCPRVTNAYQQVNSIFENVYLIQTKALLIFGFHSGKEKTSEKLFNSSCTKQDEREGMSVCKTRGRRTEIKRKQ